MNAAADRLDDSFPHGAVDGYKGGCRGNACPAGDEYGLSCKRANQLNAGDYRYQKLVKRGLTPGDIALELGLVPENPTAPVVPTKTTPTPKETAPVETSTVDEVPEPPVTDADLDAWAEDHPEPTPIPHITDEIDQLPPRIDMATPEPLTIDENALADAATAAPDARVEVATPAEFAARWNGLSDDERATWVQDMRLAHRTAHQCWIEDHATLVRLRDTRPDWATVATTEDLGNAIAQRDQARRFAENTLAELAHLEAREESALTLAMQKWADVVAERDALDRELTTLRNTLYAVRDVEAQLSEAYAEIRALADAAAERDRLAARLALSDALLTSQQHEIERQRRVIEAAAASRPTIVRDVLRIGRAR
ncbi:hypothetical protein [Microbacterium sp. PAMC21962]|uniref:hypothetical protein n=1 Tax=Microbacterium sp. PAMC21962 TaxID=2861280 RepID=UPI001C637548|nr:hypothetical protein [Microbacterium sp. PAMC21962]QYF98928.1 hypothetical protein KY498_06860 [Microbacterium sp. PAMC21962]